LVWCGACAALGGAVREYAGTVVSSGTSGYSRCWSVSMLSGSWSPVAFFLACGFFLVVVLYILHSATAVHVHVHTDIVGIRNPEVCSPRTLTCSRPDPRLCPIIVCSYSLLHKCNMILECNYALIRFYWTPIKTKVSEGRNPIGFD
jgi:hypothetical protein